MPVRSAARNRRISDRLYSFSKGPERHTIHQNADKYKKRNIIQRLQGPVQNEQGIQRVLSAADLVICRAGASTLSELSSTGKPALIVPSPNVTNNHQEKNARLVECAGGAKVLLEGEFDEEKFLEEIRSLLFDNEKLSEMSKAMHSLSVPDALDRITDAVLEYAGKSEGKK